MAHTDKPGRQTHWHDINTHKKKNALVTGSTVLDASSGIFTRLEGKEQSACPSKGHYPNSIEAVDCCFTEETKRAKAQEKEDFWSDVALGFFSEIPILGPILETGKNHNALQTELDENAQDNCYQLAARATFAAIADNKAELQKTKKAIGELAKKVKEVDEKAHEGLDKMEKIQKNMVKMEAHLDEHMGALMQSSNTLAAKLDRLSLKVIENGERVRQSAYGQLAIGVRVNIAAISHAYSTVLRLSGEITEHNDLLAKILANPGSDRAIIKSRIQGWFKADRTLRDKIAKIFPATWATMNKHFLALAVALDEGDFLSYYFREVFRFKVDKWIKKQDNKEQCSTLLKDANVKELITTLKLFKEGDMVSMIIKSSKQAYMVSTLMDMAIPSDDSSRDEFVTTLSIISKSLKQFTMDMQSEKIFGEEISQILSVSGRGRGRG